MTPNLAQPSDLTPAQIEARLAAALTESNFFGWLMASGDSALWATRSPEQEIARVVVELLADDLLAENKRLRAGIAEALDALNTRWSLDKVDHAVRNALTTLNGETDD